jgi:cytochrome c553
MNAVLPRLVAIVVSLFSTIARADDHRGSIAAGEKASLACQACHGTNGRNASPDIPDLAGQKKLYLATQLNAFKSGTRKHDLMSPIAVQLDEATIANLAAYWSSIPVSAAGPSTVRLGASQSPLSFPANFPHGFVQYRASTGEQDGSVSRFYANEVAVAAARAGKPLPEGAAIVVAAYSRGSSDPTYSMMEARAGWGQDTPPLLRNGDWRYALFDAKQQRRDNVNYARCLACHKPAADKSFVFTLGALAKAPATVAP